MEYVVEESADCACVGHLLLSGVLLGVCSCAVKEHAGAQWEGYGAATLQRWKAAVGVSDSFEWSTLEEEMGTCVIGLHLARAACCRGCALLNRSYGKYIEPGLRQKLSALEGWHPQVSHHAEPAGVGVGFRE